MSLLVGRGGQMVLRGLPDVLHVRVVGPLNKRIELRHALDALPPEAALKHLAPHAS